MKIVAILLAAALMPLAAQEIKMPASLDRLAAKAEESVDITLDGSLLKMAGRFLSGNGSGSGKGADDAATKSILAGLESITVRSFEFARDGQYDPADVESIRAQVKGPQWSRIVGVTSKKDGQTVDIYLKDAGNGNLGGLVVLSAEPRELTVVSVVGTLDPSQLANLGGHFGIPELDYSIGGKKGDH